MTKWKRAAVEAVGYGLGVALRRFVLAGLR